MISELGLEEGGAFPYLKVPASPFVCSEIASLAPAQHDNRLGTPFPFSDPDTQTDQRMAGQLEVAVTRLPVGPLLCWALLGFVCLSGEEKPQRERGVGS